MTLIWILIGIIAVSIAYFAFDREGFWRKVVGDPDLGTINFQTLQPAKKPNEGLACPADYCANRKADITTGIYMLSALDLKTKLLEKLSGLPLLSRVDDGDEALKLRFVTFSPLMRFPDTVNIEFIALDDNRSTIALHARAQIGQSDLGANAKRIKSWLNMIKEFRAE